MECLGNIMETEFSMFALFQILQSAYLLFLKSCPVLFLFKANGKAILGVVDLFFAHIILPPFLLIKSCMICLSISRDLLFHIDGLKSPNEVWDKLVEIFGKTYEMRGHQIENELISLSPSSFESLQLYFSKFKSLVL